MMTSILQKKKKVKELNDLYKYLYIYICVSCYFSWSVSLMLQRIYRRHNISLKEPMIFFFSPVCDACFC